MYRRLLHDASLYSVSSFLARGFSLITVPVYTRILSPSDYGALDLLSSLAVLLPLLLGAALDQAVARFYPDAEGRAEKVRIASTALFYNVVIFGLLVPAAWPFADELARDWLGGQVGPDTLLVVLLFMWVKSVFVIASNQLRYLFRSREYALCNIGNTVIGTGLSFSFVVVFELGVMGIFLGQLIAQALFALVALRQVRDCYGWRFSLVTLREMLAYSAPLVPGTVAFFGMQYVDRFALNELATLHDVGIYGLGARLASLIKLFLMGFQAAWLPIVFKRYKEPDAPARFRTVFDHYLFVVGAVLVVVSLFGREILFVLAAPEFGDAYIVVPLLIFSAIVASISGYFTFGIQIAKKSRYRLYVNVAALLMNIGLNIVLIPVFGVLGAGVATALSFLFVAVVSMALSERLYRVGYSWVRILGASTVAVAASSVVMFVPFPVGLASAAVRLTLAVLAIAGLAACLSVRPNRAMRALRRQNGAAEASGG